MYYAEKWIDGQLYSKTTPGGRWRLVSRLSLCYMLREAQVLITRLEAKEGDDQ